LPTVPLPLKIGNMGSIEDGEPPVPISKPAPPVDKSKTPIWAFAADIIPVRIDVERVRMSPIVKNRVSINAY
jgi:hypothetical protein